MESHTQDSSTSQEREAREMMQISPPHPSSDFIFKAQTNKLDMLLHNLNLDDQAEASGEENKEPGQPHEALYLVLAYLPLTELLAMEEVCKSLRDTTKNDVLLWLDIVVDGQWRAWRISDEILVKITSRANGRLRSLALMNCSRITVDGLQRVIKRNPLIEKLHLPGCTGLTSEGVVRAVKTLTNNHHSLKSLKIYGIFNLRKEDLESLSSCLQTKKRQQPVYYHEHRNVSALEDNGNPIDVEICQKCKEVRMVFDCPRQSCKTKGEKPYVCRGCNFCIHRCEECGGCVGYLEDSCETICGDRICLNCWLPLPKCSHCNRPYCKRHAEQLCYSSISTWWVCDACCDDGFDSSARFMYYDSEPDYM